MEIVYHKMKKLYHTEISPKCIRWKPGTLNRIEFDMLEVLKEGYRVDQLKTEKALSLDMADPQKVIQCVIGYAEELFERDPNADISVFGWGYDGYLVLFDNALSQRIRSEDNLPDEDLDTIMKIIQPDRTKPFRRRISQHLCDTDDKGYIKIWPEIVDFFGSRGLILPERDLFGYLISSFLSSAIGIYQMEKFLEWESDHSKVSDIIYYKPGAEVCGVEHYYGIRAVGVESGGIHALDVPSSQIVEPKDVWKFALELPGSFEHKGKKYAIQDLPKLIYPKELHTELGL